MDPRTDQLTPPGGPRLERLAARWITVGPADQPGTSIVLAPPAADPSVTDDERRTIVEMMAKGDFRAPVRL